MRSYGDRTGRRVARWRAAGRFVLRLALASVLILGVSVARAQDWQPELQPPANGEFRLPSEPIAFFIPPEVPLEVLQLLALELDDFDVTSFIRREGDLAVLDVVEPLAPGLHYLRLLQYGLDGTITERAFWTIEVRTTAAFRELSAGAQLGATISERLADANLQNPPDRLTGQGAGTVEATVGDDGWQTSGAANFLYDSEVGQTIDGRNLDIGEFLVGGSYAHDLFNAGVKLGHHDIGAENLIMSGFNRRGVSVSLGAADGRAEVSGFALRTESTVGIPHLTGIADPENRVQGAFATVRPIEALKDNLVISGIFYDGEGKTVGTGDGGDTASNPGHGWAAIVDSLWFEDSLRLRGEFARTGFDFDGKDTGFGKEVDDAYSLLAAYSPIEGELVGEDYVSLSLGVQHEYIGTFFNSLANPGIDADRETSSVFADLNWGELFLQSEVKHQTNNVADVAEIPTDRVLEFLLSGDYSPTIEPAEDGGLTWLGQPTLSANFSLIDVEQIDTPDGFTGNDTNNLTRSANVNVSSTYETWNWNLAHTVSIFEDQTGISSDTRNHFTNLTTQVNVQDWLTIAPYGQWDFFRDLDKDSKTHGFTLGFDTTVQMIPEVLSGTLNYSLNLQSGSGDTPDTHNVGGELLWVVLPAEVNRPGVAVSLSGSFQDRTDDVDDGLPDRIYQVFVNLKLSLPLAY